MMIVDFNAEDEHSLLSASDQCQIEKNTCTMMKKTTECCIVKSGQSPGIEICYLREYCHQVFSQTLKTGRPEGMLSHNIIREQVNFPCIYF